MIRALGQVDAVGTTTSAAALRMQTAMGRKLDVHDPAVARQTAAQFVSELFFKPILAEMRRFPIGRELATGGQTESVFGEQLDQRIADGVAAAEPGLVNAMLRNFRVDGHVAAASKSSFASEEAAS